MEKLSRRDRMPDEEDMVEACQSFGVSWDAIKVAAGKCLLRRRLLELQSAQADYLIRLRDAPSRERALNRIDRTAKQIAKLQAALDK